ncbi:MAG TPA: class I SAM-dependent methyltransferase [Methanomicrobia archaeon]|nr:class I SAM-dependent methyltransferase [Methanomicrobia archaeon]
MIEIAKPLLEPIFDLIPNKGGYILDTGTGPGTIPFAFIKMQNLKDDMRMVGTGPSQPAINFANQMAIKLEVEIFVNFRLRTFEDIPFPDNTFDVVISNALDLYELLYAEDSIRHILMRPEQCGPRGWRLCAWSRAQGILRDERRSAQKRKVTPAVKAVACT